MHISLFLHSSKALPLSFLTLGFRNQHESTTHNRHLPLAVQSSVRKDYAQHLYPQLPINQLSRQGTAEQSSDRLGCHLPLVSPLAFLLSSERTTSQLTFCRYLPPVTEKRSCAGALHFIKQFPPPLIKQSHNIPHGFNNNNQLLTGGSNCYG